MSLADLFATLARAVTVIAAVVTLIALLRHRDRQRFDMHLMFAGLAGLIILRQVILTMGRTPPALSVLGAILFLSHPYLLLRMVLHFRPVRKSILWTAWICPLVMVAIMFVANLAAARTLMFAYFLALVVFLVLQMGYVTYAFLGSARVSRGAKRWRSALAGAGTLSFTLAFFAAGMAMLLKISPQGLNLLNQSAALFTSVCYFIAFAPPRRLRNWWQLGELHRFLVRTAGLGTSERAGRSLEHLCTAATNAAGGMASVAACRDQVMSHFVVRAATMPTLLGHSFHIEHESLLRAWEQKKPVFLRGTRFGATDLDRLSEQLGADAFLAVPIATTDWTWGLLIVFVRIGSLFADDDLKLLTFLAEYTAQAVNIAEMAARQQTIIQSAPYAMLVTAPDGQILHANARAEEFFAYPPSELTGQPVRLLVPELRELEPSGGDAVDLEARRKNGTTFPVSIRSCAMTVEAQDALLLTVEDITARKEAEREVARRSAQLEAANKELEAFSYSVSHDLRAPLRAVDGFSRILEEKHGSELSNGAKRYIKLVRNNTLQMGVLIDDLLAFSRLGRQAVHKTRVSTLDLTQRVVEDARHINHGRPVDVVIGDLPECQADPALLKQVLVNLISNAIKFSRNAETPRVEIGCRQNGGPNIFFIRDNGVGFEMAYAHKLFGVFQRLHRQEDFEGTGVGLAIVQRIIQRHGGRVWADSQPGQGATFYFSFEEGPEDAHRGDVAGGGQSERSGADHARAADA